MPCFPFSKFHQNSEAMRNPLLFSVSLPLSLERKKTLEEFSLLEKIKLNGRRI
uniref:Uncharacterized protein n=1 Tax=Rhizophora mucronata TaxID=61149 RepID=A0A2P2J2B7_RHIMU